MCRRRESELPYACATKTALTFIFLDL